MGWRGCARGGATVSKRFDIGGVAEYWQLFGIDVEDDKLGGFAAVIVAVAVWGFVESSLGSYSLSG